MIFSFFGKKLKDISISRKLYFTVGIMALLVTIELCTLFFAVNTLSAVRSFVAGEGLWSKAEKDAVLKLHMYAYTHDDKDYQTFLTLFKIPAGDRATRIELQKPNPDMAIARQGFINGGNHPEDVDGMIFLLKHFSNISYLKKAFTLWAGAEPIINELIKTGHTIHNMIEAGATQKDLDRELVRMTVLNQQLSAMENGFSSTLGEGARWLEGLVLKLLLTLSLTIGTTSIIITISVSRGIEKGLDAIITGADLISEGALHHRVQVYSNDEIGILATAFNQMTDKLQSNLREIRDKEENVKKERDKAEASEKVKQLFLMNMSHEIRTPMNAILGFAHLLEDALDDKEQQEYVQLLIRAGNELLVILNDILDFSKMESGRVSLETMPFNLKDMVQTLINDTQPKADIKNIHLSYYVDAKIPEVVLGDPKRLNQVLVNLLSNAVKFTDRGEISMAVYVMSDHHHHIELEFSVKDTGIGIAEEHQEKIFERFEQATAGTERRFGGTGLGLSIVKQLVELQGGKVFVNSTPGRGSEFHFRISFLKVKTGGPMDDNDTVNLTLEPTVKTNEGPCILVVDDNPMNRMLVIRILQKKGFDTDWAENGKVCLNKYLDADYDMILMDLQMPEMDGYEATKQIRNLDNDKKDVPIIAMTAHALEGEEERCMALGMNAFIPKPFYPEDLYDKINELLA
jgi:signal transduction histidine kinase